MKTSFVDKINSYFMMSTTSPTGIRYKGVTVKSPFSKNYSIIYDYKSHVIEVKHDSLVIDGETIEYAYIKDIGTVSSSSHSIINDITSSEEFIYIDVELNYARKSTLMLHLPYDNLHHDDNVVSFILR